MINAHYCVHARYYGNQVGNNLFHAVEESAKKTEWIRLASLPIGIIYGLVLCATDIAHIAESLFKGSINLYNGFRPFSHHVMGVGLAQVFVMAPIIAAISALCVITAPISVSYRIVRIALSPLKYAQEIQEGNKARWKKTKERREKEGFDINRYGCFN